MILMMLLLITVGCGNEAAKESNEKAVAVDGGEEAEVDVAVETEMEAMPDGELTVVLNMLGRASVRLDYSDGKVVYIDPYLGSAKNYEVEADLVLVTHQHIDHNAVERVTLKADTKIVECPTDIRVGMKETVKGIEIIAVEAYNNNHTANESCGFIIKYGDIVIYHSGDTSTTRQMASMADFEIDYAMLCMDGYFNMGPEEAMAVTDLIKPGAVIPIHTAQNGSYDKDNVMAFTHPLKMDVKPGQSVVLRDLHSDNESAEDSGSN